MPSLKLSNPFRRGADRPSLKDRAAALKATAGRIMGHRPLPPLNRGAPEASPLPVLNGAAPDGIYAAIKGHAEAVASWRAEPDGSDEAFERHAAIERAADKALRETPTHSLADLRTKLTYLVPLMAPDMLDQTHVAHLEAIRDDVDRLCRRTAAGANQDIALSPDPIFAAIEAWEAAERAWMVFSDAAERIAERGPAIFEEDRRLGQAQRSALDAALSTVPTTRAGQLALLDFLRRQMKEHGQADGGPPDEDCPIWRDSYRALSAALAAPIPAESQAYTAGREAASDRIGMPDLERVSVNRLARLYDHLQGLIRIASMACNAPMAWDDDARNLSPVGHFLEDECERLDKLADQVAGAIRSRSPVNERERDERLVALVKHELELSSRINDPAMLADLATAWGA